MGEIKITDSPHKTGLALSIDGAIYEQPCITISESRAELQTDSVGGDSFFEVVILDSEIADVVMAHRFSDLSKEIMRIVIRPSVKLIEGETEISQDITIRRDFVGVRGGYVGQNYLAITIYIEPSDQARWRGRDVGEYEKEFRRIFERQNFPDIKWRPEEARIRPTGTIEVGISLENRISLLFEVKDVDATIESEAFKHAGILKHLHELTEFSLKSQYPNRNVEKIIRSIEFPPEYHRSGVTILSYFADVLRHKNLSEEVKVSIEQNGLNVSLIIETPTGRREQIEQTLKIYGMVVLRKQPPESLTTDPYELAELKSQLRYAEVQIETQRELLAAKKADVESLRAEVKDTRDMVRGFMSLMEGLVSHNTALATSLKELAQQAAQGQNKALENALENLSKMLDRGVREEDREEVLQNLTTIQREDPGVFQRVYDTLLMGAISEGAGNYLYSWLLYFVNTLPK